MAGNGFTKRVRFQLSSEDWGKIWPVESCSKGVPVHGTVREKEGKIQKRELIKGNCENGARCKGPWK